MEAPNFLASWSEVGLEVLDLWLISEVGEVLCDWGLTCGGCTDSR